VTAVTSSPQSDSLVRTGHPIKQSSEDTTPDEWSIPEVFRAAVMARQVAIAVDQDLKPSEQTAAARCLIAMSAQSLAVRKAAPPPSLRKNKISRDLNVLINVSPDERRQRIDALFARLGARERGGETAGRHVEGDPIGFDRLPHAEGTGGGEPA
jgi:hypothetical protein